MANAVLPNGAPLGVVLLGVVIGSLDALTALGLVLVYRAARIINFAQAEIGGLAAGVVTVTVAGLDVPYFAALGLGLAAALLTGFLIDATVVRRFFTAPRLILMVATLGVAQVLGALQIALPTWFTDLDLFESVQSPLTATVQVGPVVFTGDHLVAVVTVPIVLIAPARSSSPAAGSAWPCRRPPTRTSGPSCSASPSAACRGSPGWSRPGSPASPPCSRPRSSASNLGSIAGPQALLVPIAAAVIARMQSLGVAVGAAIGLGDLPTGVLLELAPIGDRRRRHVRRSCSSPSSSSAAAAERVSGGDLGGYTALREVRPIPRSSPSLPEVRLLRHAARAGRCRPRRRHPRPALRVPAVVLDHPGDPRHPRRVPRGAHRLGRPDQPRPVRPRPASAARPRPRLLVEWSGDLFLALAAATVVAGAAAVAVGLPALRIPGMFFAVTTLALSVPVATWLLNPTYFAALTPSSISRPHLLERYELDSPLRWYYLCLAALGAALVVVRRFRGHPAGPGGRRRPRQRAGRRRLLDQPEPDPARRLRPVRRPRRPRRRALRRHAPLGPVQRVQPQRLDRAVHDGRHRRPRQHPRRHPRRGLRLVGPVLPPGRHPAARHRRRPPAAPDVRPRRSRPARVHGP